MTRYEAGETLASIARTYDCSPPAISYIVSRSRSRQPAAEAPAVVSEPQLIKAPAGEAVAVATPEPVVAPAAAAPPRAAPAFEHPGEGNGFIRNGAGDRPGGITATMTRPLQPRPNAAPQPSSPLNGEHRRTLHLSLGGGNGNGNGSNGHVPSPEPPPPGNGVPQGQAAPQPYPGERFASRQAPPPPRDQPRYGFPPHGAANGGERGMSEARFEPEAARRKDSANFIDQELRARVDGDIAVFLAAFDAALAGDTQESRSGLREATDRLLRAGARTRIELERLEARVPLGPRDGAARAEANWRHR